jgi:RecA-family ATPase
MNVSAPINYFDALWLRGFKHILPIIPPGSTLSSSSLVTPAKLGKIPGKKKPDGWIGFVGWQNHVTRDAELAEWFGWGAGVGIRCDNGLVAIDTDPDEPADAAIIKTCIAECLGAPPTRVGQDPRALFVCRTDPDFTHPKVLFRETAAIDILTQSGHQFIAAGLHPRTMSPYRWTVPLVAFDQISVIAPERLEELFETLKNRLPDGRFAVAKASTRGPPPPQKDLKGRLEDVKRAVEAIPNDYDDRGTYINMAYAIRAALPDDIQQGSDIFWEWCDRWKSEEGNDEEFVRKEFLGLTPPFRRGASWLYETAELRSPELFSRASIWHEPVSEVSPVATAATVAPPSAHGFNIVKASSFAGLPVPQQRWLVKDIVPERNVTMLAGDGATGKSLIAVQLGAAVATGTPWLGSEVERGRVLFFTAEDEIEELQRRAVDICRAPAPFTLADLDDLNFISFHGEDAVMAAPQGKEGLLAATPIFRRLRLALDALRPTLLFLDTQADLFGGDENKRVHARQFIVMLQKLVKDYEMTVILLSHPSLSGLNSGSGTSGNTAWNNSVRSRLYLTRRIEKDGTETDPDLRFLTIKKANRSRVGAKLILRWVAGRFVREGIEDDTPAVDRRHEADAAFLAILDRMTSEGRPVSHKETANNFAPTAFEKNPLAKSITASAFEAAMERLFASGAITVADYGPPSKRYKQIVRGEIKPVDVLDSDLFG